MKKLLVILALVGFIGCGERVDLPTRFLTASCAVSSQTDTDITISCNDGTTVTIEKPERVVTEEVEVPVIVEVPSEECEEETKITVCHKGRTIEIALAALPAHEGDMIGACVEVPPCEGEECGDDEEPEEGPVEVTLCHKPGTGAEKTISVPAPAVPGHLGHGDYLGECEDE